MVRTHGRTALASWVAVGLIAATFAVAVLVAGAGTTAAARTCNLSVNSENSANNSVQSAINSADPGWTICLGAGTYPEQLTISTPSLKIVGAGAALTIIAPTSVSQNTYDWDNVPALPLDAIVLVDNTTGVTLQGLTVNGTAAAGSITGCSPGYAGVDFQNSSGALVASAVRGVQLAPSLLGCQTQLAVYVYTGYYGTSYTPSPSLAVRVQTTTITSYGKNGITCDDPGLVCTIVRDTVTGIGSTPATAQNGIQVGFGATASVLNNRVSGDIYSGATATNDWYGNGYQASGILLYFPGAGTLVSKNTVSASGMSIVDYGQLPVKIVGNKVTGSTAYGIVANGLPGAHALIANNTVSSVGTGAPGILVDNGSFNVSGNKISGVSASGTNGANQTVCGPTSYLTCTPDANISTAAIQAVSESGVGPTGLTLFSNTFTSDVLSVATLAVAGGSVSVNWIV